jgi:hypothetical protein
LYFGGFDDWFLPSRDELNLMYTILKAKGLGNFQNVLYWSSSQTSEAGSWGQRFSDGSQTAIYENISSCVRAVRAF